MTVIYLYNLNIGKVLYITQTCTITNNTYIKNPVVCWYYVYDTVNYNEPTVLFSSVDLLQYDITNTLSEVYTTGENGNSGFDVSSQSVKSFIAHGLGEDFTVYYYEFSDNDGVSGMDIFSDVNQYLTHKNSTGKYKLYIFDESYINWIEKQAKSNFGANAYKEYLQKKQEYDTYVQQKQAYDKNKQKYEEYLVKKQEYDEYLAKKQKYDKYISDLQIYSTVMDTYTKKLEQYNKDMEQYKKDLEEYNKTHNSGGNT